MPRESATSAALGRFIVAIRRTATMKKSDLVFFLVMGATGAVAATAPGPADGHWHAQSWQDAVATLPCKPFVRKADGIWSAGLGRSSHPRGDLEHDVWTECRLAFARRALHSGRTDAGAFAPTKTGRRGWWTEAEAATAPSAH